MIWLDKALAWVATGGKSDDWQVATDSNDAHIAQNWERIIADPRTSGFDRMAAERELAVFRSEQQQAPRVYEGATTAALEGATEGARGFIKGIRDSIGGLLPWYVWLILVMVLAAYLLPFFLRRK